MAVKSTDRGSKGFGQNKILDQHMVQFYDSTRVGRGTNEPIPYEVGSSVRFNYDDTNYFYRDFSVQGNRQKWTFSAWVKRSTPGNVSDPQFIFGADASSTISNSFIGFSGIDEFRFQVGGSTTASYRCDTFAIARDYSAWMHIVAVLDTTAPSSSDRVKLWVNGVIQQFNAANYPPLNYSGGQINGIFKHALGIHYDIGGSSTNYPFGGYIADVHFIDGQALTPSSFAETSSTTGQWVAKPYTGTYGTTGFRLPLPRDAVTVGYDASGNGNNWTSVNISLTPGVGYDGMVDSPTRKGTDNGLGGELLGNYATLNPIDPLTTVTPTNGNLDYVNPGLNYTAVTTIGVGTGKWYWEIVTTGGTTETKVGVYDGTTVSTLYSLAANNTVYGVRFDADAGTLDVTSNGSTWTSIATGLVTGLYVPYFKNTGTTSKTVSINFGQRAYTYTAPSGYKTLCSFNIPDPPENVKASMDVVEYTGTGTNGFSPTNVSGKSLQFSPNLVWIKNRETTNSYRLYDTERGVGLALETNVGDPQINDGGVSSFNSNGFTLDNGAPVNNLGDSHIAWCWNESVLSGFDIVKYTGNGANRQISHALGVVPDFIIIKCYDTSTTDWVVWNKTMPNTRFLKLNTDVDYVIASTMFNSTSPTSSVFSLGTNGDVNTNNANYVAYLWSSVEGYSSFGKYVGNSSTNGPFVYCGFKPRWVIIKSYDQTGSDWVIYDSERDSYNPATRRLRPNLNNVEASGVDIDILSNGFKIRSSGIPVNTVNINYIYAAFAEVPFKYSRAV